jgi:hypothetical protein
MEKWKMPEEYKSGNNLSSLPDDVSFNFLSDYILPIGPDEKIVVDKTKLDAGLHYYGSRVIYEDNEGS